MKVKRMILKIGIGLVIILSIVMFAVTKDIPKLKSLPIESVVISNLADGTYKGRYEFSRWKSEVEVTVRDGVLTDIKRLSDPLTPDVSDELFQKMIGEQKVDVDVVTGATATSKAYMKSVENALAHAEE